MYLLLYVDDILMFSTNESEISKLKALLSENFKIKDLGLISNIVGLNVKQYLEKGITVIDQDKYLRNVLNKFNMSECQPINTPMDKGF